MDTAQHLDLEKQRHSLAHILAFAVKRLYPDAKLGIGPVTDNGFYYEFDTEHKFTHEDLKTIEEEMQKIIEEDLPFTNIVVSREQALNTLLQLGETFKTELLNNILDSEVSFYKTGEEFIDLCRGPHVKKTSELKNFKLTKISKSYWLNDLTRPQMQKITGVSFANERKLNEYLENIRKLSEINSILIAERLELIRLTTHSKVSAPIWLKNGIYLFQNIVHYLEEQITESGVDLVQEPWISNKIGILESNTPSYIINKPLQVTVGNESIVFRNNTESFLLTQLLEDINHKSKFKKTSISSVFKAFDGELLDLNMKRPEKLTEFMETTYPIILTAINLKDVQETLISQIRLIGTILKAFGFNQFKLILEVPDYSNLSKYIYDAQIWDDSISALKELVTELKIPSKIREGEAEFYGPKLTFEVKDKYDRNWEISKLVLDPILPRKLLIDKKLSKDCVFIHTYLLTSIEKLLDLLLEHGEGQLPLWVEPEQVEIVALEKQYLHKAIKLARELKENNIKVKLSQSTKHPEAKISKAVEKKTPYILIIGEKEAETDSISVKYNAQDIGLMRSNEFIQRFDEEIRQLFES